MVLRLWKHALIDSSEYSASTSGGAEYEAHHPLPACHPARWTWSFCDDDFSTVNSGWLNLQSDGPKTLEVLIFNPRCGEFLPRPLMCHWPRLHIASERLYRSPFQIADVRDWVLICAMEVPWSVRIRGYLVRIGPLNTNAKEA